MRGCEQILSSRLLLGEERVERILLHANIRVDLASDLADAMRARVLLQWRDPLRVCDWHATPLERVRGT